MRTNWRQSEFALLSLLIVLALVSVAFVLGEAGMGKKKRCTKCGELKGVREFHKTSSRKDGLKNWCKGCCQEYDRKYYQEHIDSKWKYNHKYRREHKEDSREYERKRRRNNPMIRLSRGFSCGIRDALNGNKNGRHWESLVNFTLQELKEHLESLFLPGMTWDNYGYGDDKWNIDHRMPISSFNFISAEDEDFKKCWALSNLQPLWQIDNFKKGNRID